MFKLISISSKSPLKEWKTSEIYAYIKPRICQIETIMGKTGTGFFVKVAIEGAEKVWLATCLHSAKIQLKCVEPDSFLHINILIQDCLQKLQLRSVPSNDEPLFQKVSKLPSVTKEKSNEIFL